MLNSRLKFIGLLLISCLTSKSQAQTETYSWHNVAMGGGGFVTGIITNKTEQNLLYARTDVGGAYRWDAANSKWIPLLDWTSDSELGYQGVESIATDPVEPNKVYMLVGTSYFNNGKSAILRSSDYGNTFSITDVTSQFKAHGNGMGRQSGEKLIIDSNLNTTLYCGTRANGLFRSTDSGVNWSRLTSLNITTTTNENGISFVVLDPSTGSAGNATQTIIAGISRSGTANLYRSNDGGATFSEIAGAPTTLMPHRAALTSDRKLFITYANNAGPWDISGSGQIVMYDLQAGTFTNVTPAGFTGAFGGISADPANPTRLVASSLNSWLLQDNNAYGDRFFLTTNGGTTWTDVIARGFDLSNNGHSWIDGAAIHWCGSIEFDPFDSKKAWVVSGNGIFQTEDIDATNNVWKFQVHGMEETVPQDLVSIPNGPVVSVISDYDGSRQLDVTQYAPTHVPHMGSTHSVAYASLNRNIMLRIGDTKMYRSEDMGLTWMECNRTGSKGSVALSADGKVFLYSHESANSTFRSTDNGNTWTAATGVSVTWARPLADPINPSKIYVYDPSSGSMMVSTNAGVSFSAAGSAGTGGSKIIRAVPRKEGDIWVPLYGGGLTRSTNSGTSFTKITNVTYCGAVGFGKEAPGKTFPTVYIWGTVSGVLGVYRSTNSGVSWTRVNDNAHEYGGPANGQFVVGDMNVYGRVYMSTAGRGIVYGESDQTCLPTMITPNLTTNGTLQEKATVTTLDEGGNVILSPNADGTGTWSWIGPSNFTSSNREVNLSNIQNNQAGVYSVTYTNAEGCKSGAQAFLINVNVVTGANSEGNNELRVYPNPTSGKITVASSINITDVVVVDSLGRTVWRGNLNETEMQIDLSKLASGVYFVKGTSGNKQSIVKRLIKK